MPNKLPPLVVIDVGPASWGSAQFLANELKLASAGSGMSFPAQMTQAARENRKINSEKPDSVDLTNHRKAFPSTGLLAGLLRRI